MMTKTRDERGTLWALSGIILVVLLIVGGLGLRWVLAGPTGAVQQREQTIGNGNYRIAAYDSFYNLCGDIQAKEDQIKNTEDRPVTEGTASGFTEAQKQTILLALNNSRASLIREYNADASKADTQANFMASDLPYKIDVNGETVCAR